MIIESKLPKRSCGHVQSRLLLLFEIDVTTNMWHRLHITCWLERSLAFQEWQYLGQNTMHINMMRQSWIHAVKRGFLLVMPRIALHIFYPDTGIVLKNRLVKFITKYQWMWQSDRWENERSHWAEEASWNQIIKTWHEKKKKTIPQEIKAETCDTNTNLGNVATDTLSKDRKETPSVLYGLWVQGKICNMQLYCCRVACDVPQTLKEALISPQSELWVKAITRVFLQSLIWHLYIF